MKQVFNPYLPEWEYIPDGEPKVFNQRLYIYGSHDKEDGNDYCLEDYVCYSAPIEDLSDWKYEGIIYEKEDDPSNRDGHLRLFAPDVTQGPDGRYYLYYGLSFENRIGVAVCDTPSGHYTYLGDVAYSNGKLLDGAEAFDPAILSGDMGNWLYYGFCLKNLSSDSKPSLCKGGYCVELEDDMMTIKNSPRKVLPGAIEAKGTPFENHGFLEASSIRYIHNQYYLIYSSENGHELCYAISHYPDRNFNYQGVIISNGDVGIDGRKESEAVYYLGNNHGGIAQVKDKFYIFYHRHTHGHQYSRQGCAEEIFINQDGIIKQVEMTSCGLNKDPLITGEVYSAGIACHLRSKLGILHYSSKIKWNEDHPYISQENKQQFIYNLRDKGECGYKYFYLTGNETKISVCVRGNFLGTVNLYLDNIQDEAIARIEITPTSKWFIFRGNMKKSKGIHAVYFQFIGIGSCDFKNFKFS